MEPQRVHPKPALKNLAAEWIRPKAPKSTKGSGYGLPQHLTSQHRNDDDEDDHDVLYDCGSLWLGYLFQARSSAPSSFLS